MKSDVTTNDFGNTRLVIIDCRVAVQPATCVDTVVVTTGSIVAAVAAGIKAGPLCFISGGR